MAVLSATFEAIDRMSDVLGNMANSGEQAISQFESAADTANAALGQTISAANEVARAMETSAQSTDYWTAAVGNYDKGAMEAIYSTEELVEMGFKSAEALNEQNEMFALCEKSASELSQSMNATVAIEENLSNAMKDAAEISGQVADADGVSAEAKEELSKASEAAATALEELHRAQEEAAAAMEAYDATMMSGTTDLAELEAAAERAGHAAENLAEANGNATNATEELSNASDKASEELENAGNKGAKAFDELSSALAAAGITAMLKEIAEAAYELADAFSEAQKTVVLATGATDEALSGLEDSMMNAYAAAKSADLSETAGAIGEINTRLGLTGESLENVTSLFLDYANITNQDVVSSVGNVTKLMNQWGVELENVEGLMDKLSYAGQMSGINVGSLTDSLVTNRAILQQVGFTLDDSIGLLAQAELQGISTQTMMMGLRTAITNFSSDGLNASTALREVVNDIANIGDESEATALAIDTFGSRAGAILAGSIRGGQLSIDNLSASLEKADGTLKNTAEASQTLGEKWQQSSNKVKTAFTGSVEPVINKYSTALANATGKMGDFLNAHPKVTAGLTAVGVGLGVVTLGIVGATTVVNVAIPAFISLGTAINAALGPVGWIAIGIVGVTAAAVTLAEALGDTTSEYDKLTAASKKQYDEIQALSDEYDKACEVYGENSQQAKELQGELIILQNEFENSKMTVEEFENALQSTADSIADTASSYDEAVASIDKEYSSVTALIARLEQLTTADDGTAASQAEILAIVEELNKQFPELNLNYEDVINNTQATVEALEEMAMKEYKTEKASEAWDSYKKSMGDIASAQDSVTAATNSQAAAQEKLNALMQSERYKEMQQALENLAPSEAAGREFAATYQGISAEVSKAQEELRYWDDALEKANTTLDEAKTKSEEYLNAYMEASGITAEMKDTTDEASAAIENASYQLQLLAQEYESAYTAALNSFGGQFDLFDIAKADMESTVAAAQKALDSQVQYWSNYASNIDVLKGKSAEDLGVTKANYEGLMSYVQTATPEAAGLAQSMVNAINSGNQQAVAKLIETYGLVHEKQQAAASSVAAWQTDFDNKANQIVQKMQTTMQDLNMSEEATAAATSTMTSYANAISTSGAKAVSNAKNIAAQVKAALQSGSANINIGTTGGVGKGYATGTKDATPGFHIVGEEGPEIVAFEGGETVYDAAETEKILSSARPTPLHINAPEGVEGQQTQNVSTKDKRIVLAIEGGGEIKVPAGVDKETVIQLITTNLKPTLLNILQEEVFEEGDGSYAY